MKANELMLGDWVVDSTEEYVKIDGMGCSDYNEINRKQNLPILTDDENDRYIGIINPAQKRSYNEHLGFIKSIPLTEEIFKANGFDIVQDGDSLTIWKQEDDEYGNEVYDITIYACEGVTRYDTSIRYHGAIRKNIKFVHELQHSLRLCGLDELADSFKIK